LDYNHNGFAKKYFVMRDNIPFTQNFFGIYKSPTINIATMWQCFPDKLTNFDILSMIIYWRTYA